MKTLNSKAAAVILSGAVALSCASCSLFGGGAKTEDIVDAADAFAKALVSCNTGKIVKLTNEDDDSDAVKELEANLNGLLFSPEQDQIAEAVADTLEYEIDEESVKIDKDEASVDVTFTMVDYETALGDGEFADADEAVAAIKDCGDTCEVEITFEFEKDEDEWLISNLGDKAYSKLYGFYGLDVSFMPDFVIVTSFADHDDYNTTVVMTVGFSEDLSDYADGFTFDIYLNGELDYVDQTQITFDGEYAICTLYVPGGVEPGTYTVTLKYNDEELVSESVEVDNSSSGEPSFFEGDVFLCTVDFGECIEEELQEGGFDVDMDGELILDLYLMLGSDGTYTLEPDLTTFEPNLESYLYDNMDEENMIAFVGVSSAEDLEATAAEMNTDVDGLRDILIEAMVDSAIANVTGDTDQGTYTFDGDTISFDSDSLSNFEGTLESDGSISLVNDYFSPETGYVLEFYYVG